ncbi:alpha/beta fold hydrolase [Georgenia thermotolerans]|uniref:Alpha/beta fold hydrolase n=1 Tax=Georgenia thermotolerans TaxID=527326 RepID=A0A7J5US56_9MICO|nr:alpha/beta hydrolase [Georgenia thermotolerans]KAE8764663.1 alpha/beta fold hydrolase [Georgenia thermotolerans]
MTTTPSAVRASARLAALRAAFAAADRLAPDLAARWALRVWCTLPRNGGRRRDERPEPGTTSAVPLPGGRRVVVESWGAGEPVYLAHGWGGWRGQLGAFVAPLVAAGRRVVAFDAPSHGESPPGHLGPRRSTAIEIAEAFTAVADVHGAPVAVVAHSLGCTTTALAVRAGLPVGRLALVAPSVDVMSMTAELARVLGYGERTRTRFERRLEALAGRPVRDFDLAEMTLPTPTLVVHDRHDKEVPYADGVRVAGAWPAARLHTTESLGHQRILRDPGVVAEVTRFVVP